MVEDLGLFPAWEMDLLRPELMPDAELRNDAQWMDDALDWAGKFMNLFRAALGLVPETDFIKGEEK